MLPTDFLAGPYVPPQRSRGLILFCHYRDCDVRVTSFTDGRAHTEILEMMLNEPNGLSYDGIRKGLGLIRVSDKSIRAKVYKLKAKLKQATRQTTIRVKISLASKRYRAEIQMKEIAT
ncbi:MAG: hypothetical protein K8T89_23265 [Planctomycetes bacterium]|nr:hypothetical protein [Planctomycetota bacterium]